MLERFPGRLLTEVIDELNRLDGPNYPEGLLGHVLEAGAYRQAKQMTDTADTPEARKRLPKGGMFKLVPLIKAEMVKASMEGGDE